MQNNLDEAIACYRQAIEINPKLAPVHNNLAWLLATANEIELRNPSEALDLREPPFNSTQRTGVLGHVERRRLSGGGLENVVQCSPREARAHPITTEDRWFLAMTHWQLGNQVDARKSYDEAVAETTNEQTTTPRLRSLHLEANQLLGITTSTTQPEGGDSPPEE